MITDYVCKLLFIYEISNEIKILSKLLVSKSLVTIPSSYCNINIK